MFKLTALNIIIICTLKIIICTLKVCVTGCNNNIKEQVTY